MSVIPPWLDRCMFDVLVDEMRTHSSEWLESRRREVIGAQRELHTEELAIVRVLDERGRVDCSIGAHGESARMVRDKVDTARALESLPEIGRVAFEGGFSDEQLSAGGAVWPTRSRIGSGRRGRRTWIRSSSAVWRGRWRSRRRRIRGRGTRRVSCGCGGPATRGCCTCEASCPT